MSESHISPKASRRQFVGGFSSAIVAATSLGANGKPLATQTASAANTKLMDEAYWTFVSKHFLLEGGLTYLNAGTTGAMPTSRACMLVS